MRILIVAAAGCLLASEGFAHGNHARVECEKVKVKIRYIRSKMRAGHTRAQGEKMEAELRKLRALRSKLCR